MLRKEKETIIEILPKIKGKIPFLFKKVNETYFILKIGEADGEQIKTIEDFEKLKHVDQLIIAEMIKNNLNKDNPYF